LKNSFINKVFLIFYFIIICSSCARKKVIARHEALRLKTDTSVILIDDLEIEGFVEGLKEHIQRLDRQPSKNMFFGEILYEKYYNSKKKIRF